MTEPEKNNEPTEEVNPLEAWQREVLGADYEEELGIMAEKRELIDVETLMRHADTIRNLELSTLGCFVPIKPLRIGDRIEINEITHRDAVVQRDLRNRHKAYLLLSRADPRYTEEVIDTLPAHVIDTILTEHLAQEEEPFLLPLLKRRSVGLGKPRRLNAS